MEAVANVVFEIAAKNTSLVIFVLEKFGSAASA
jgi:hypothetical protein